MDKIKKNIYRHLMYDYRRVLFKSIPMARSFSYRPDVRVYVPLSVVLPYHFERQLDERMNNG